jgi:hypothetical protein
VACEVDERVVAEGPRMQGVVNECVARWGEVYSRRRMSDGAYVYSFGTVRGGLTDDVLVAERWVAERHGYPELADLGWSECEAGCGRQVRVEPQGDGGHAVVDGDGSTDCTPSPGGARRVHR